MAKQNKLDMRKEKKHLAEAVVAFHQAHHAWYNYDGNNSYIRSQLYLCRKNAERCNCMCGWDW